MLSEDLYGPPPFRRILSIARFRLQGIRCEELARLGIRLWWAAGEDRFIGRLLMHGLFPTKLRAFEQQGLYVAIAKQLGFEVWETDAETDPRASIAWGAYEREMAQARLIDQTDAGRLVMSDASFPKADQVQTEPGRHIEPDDDDYVHPTRIVQGRAYASGMQRMRSAARIWPTASLTSARRDPTSTLIYGVVGDEPGEGSMTGDSLVEQINQIHGPSITVRINCRGGSRTAAVAVYDALRRHGARIRVRITGVAFSAGSLIAMAGDHVEAYADALLMLHGPLTCGMGLAGDLRRAAAELDALALEVAEIYVRKCGEEKRGELRAMLTDGRDHYLTAQEALGLGLIDSIVERT